jgi:transposase
MKAYSEDLRTTIVRAVENSMSKSGAALLFGVSLPSVKRYSRIASRGDSVEPRKDAGRPPKTDHTTQKLLKEEFKEHPAATIVHRRRFLEHVTGKALSDYTVCRLLRRRMRLSPKNGW